GELIALVPANRKKQFISPRGLQPSGSIEPAQERSAAHRTHCPQSWLPHSMFFIFQRRAHSFMLLMTSIISRPLSVRVYSLFRGKAAPSIFFSTSPSPSSSLSRAERTFWVIPARQAFNSENRLVCPSPLYSSSSMSMVHFLAIYFTVWFTVHPS